MFVHLEIREGVGYVTLNRPEKRNAINRQLLDDFKKCVSRLDDAGVKVAVLRASGSVFCAGADLGEIATGGETSAEMFRTMTDASVLWIAFVERPVMGAGLGLLQCCAVVLASATTTFVLPEVNKGFFPADMIEILHRSLDVRSLFWMALSGAPISAAEAKSIGLVSELAVEEDLQVLLDHVLARLSSSHIAEAAAECWSAIAGNVR
jgi:enoyl-CoA hydratase/carnithine racemase